MDERIIGTERRAGAIVEDVLIDALDLGDPIKAYRVRPEQGDVARAATNTPAASAPGPGIVWAHWFDPDAPDGDRSQYVDEAVDLAGVGITSLLPQGRFPWAVAPTGAAADARAIETEVQRLRVASDVLIADPSVDPERLALVGHDFGGMAAIVAATAGPSLRALVVVAATPRWADWFLPFWPIPDDRIEYLRTLRPWDPIERIGSVAADAVLLQMARSDFYIAPMSGLELHRAAPRGARLETYESNHAMRDPAVRMDRRAFLLAALGDEDV